MIINELQLKEYVFDFIKKNTTAKLYRRALYDFLNGAVVEQKIVYNDKNQLTITTLFSKINTRIDINSENFNIKYTCSLKCKALCVHTVTSLINFISDFYFDYYTLFKQSLSPFDFITSKNNRNEIYGVIVDDENGYSFALVLNRKENSFYLKHYIDFDEFIKFNTTINKNIFKDKILFAEFMFNCLEQNNTSIFFIRKGKRALTPLKLDREDSVIKFEIAKLNEDFFQMEAYYNRGNDILTIFEGIGKRLIVFSNGKVKILRKISDFRLLDRFLNRKQVLSYNDLQQIIFMEDFLKENQIELQRDKIEGFNVIDSEPDVNIFLDAEGNFLSVKVELEYGDYTFNILTKERVKGDTIILRHGIEYEIEDILTKLSCGLKSDSFLFSGDNALDFLINILPVKFYRFNIFGEKKLTNFRIKYPSSVAGMKVFSYKEWFELKGVLDFDGKKAALASIVKSIKEGKRYVKLANNEYGVIPESFYKKIVKILGNTNFIFDKKKDKIKIHKINSIETDEIFYGFNNSEKILQEMRLIRDKLNNFDKIKDLELPEKFNKILRKYQKEGVKWLRFLKEYHLNGILADEMGLGKTVQTLTHLRLDNGNAPNLIIVPTSLLYNWENEIKKFSYAVQYLILYGKEREKHYNNIQNYKIVLTTYNIVRIDIELLKKLEFNYIVLDEAQYIKNPSSVITKYIKKLNCRHRLSLTGTPFENSITDIWSQFDFLHPGLLGNLKDFNRKYSTDIKTLKKKLQPLILRRKKEEVLKELPPKTEILNFYDMNEQQYRFYNSVKAFYLEKIITSLSEKGISRSRLLIIEGLLRLRQICCHPKLVDFEHISYKNIKSEKFENFKKLLLNLMKKNGKTVVYSQFVEMLKIIKTWLNKKEIIFEYLDGSTRNRMNVVERFQNDTEVKVFLVSTKAGGLGINLTAAENVIIYDPWWNPAVENQAIDRIHRIGQDKKVFAYKLLIKNSVEEKILELQKKKKNISEQLLHSETFLSDISKDDIDFIFS